MKKTRDNMFIILVCVVMIGLLISIMLYNGILQINMFSVSSYDIHGVDVSSYQGEIDWSLLSSNDIDFAYIKATEGSTHVDRYFKQNWTEASKTDLKVGAYHFFSFDSSGENQAANFISNVPKENNKLPPVIDLEFYGGYLAGNINAEKYVQIREDLEILYDTLYAHYGVYPILYITEETYFFFEVSSLDCRLWARSVYGTLNYLDDQWLFWQYSNRKRLSGYSGEEKYIDMNVFNGSSEELEEILS